MHKVRHIVVQVWKRNTILGAYGLPYNNLVYIIELIPVLVTA